MPRNRGEKSGNENLFVDRFKVNHAFADRFGDGGTENECGDEIPECCPQHGFAGCENAGGYNSGNGISGVMPAVGKIKGQGDSHNEDDEVEAAHADRKSTRLNSSHRCISYAVFCLKKKNLIGKNNKYSQRIKIMSEFFNYKEYSIIQLKYFFLSVTAPPDITSLSIHHPIHI